jgi:3-deoxy-D-manno-octulosonic-acid transferase
MTELPRSDHTPTLTSLAGDALPSRSRLGYAAYDIAGIVLAVLALPVLPWLCLTRHGRGLGERLGMLPDAARTLDRPIWLHAASVGEVLATEALVTQLRQQYPHLPVVISTTTVTGREAARTRLPIDAAFLLPLDVGWVVDRVMRTLRPRCLVLVETEIWPALVRAAARAGVPRLIVSGRISERAAARYEWITWLTRAVLALVDAFAMQTADDARRVIALGAPPGRVRVLGNLKFARSAATPTGATEPALVAGRPLLVAVSTHPGEERVVLDACVPLWQDRTLLLVIAPRRPERFDEVATLLDELGLHYERRSQIGTLVQAQTQVLLLDTLGELPALLPAARAVFVGGTLAPVGGHNVAEPALFAKPVAFGPRTENVAAAAAALLAAGAATRVQNATELSAEWRRLLVDPAGATRMGARGRAVVEAGAGIAQQTLELIREYVNADVEC